MKKLRYMIEAALAALSYALLRILPVTVSSYIFGKLARLIGPLFKANKTANKNLKHAFPEMEEDVRASLIKDMWENLGRTVGEFSYIGRCNKEEFERVVQVQGAEYLKEHLAAGKRVIFFSAHMANWELAPKTAAIYGTPLALVYRPSNNPMVEKIIKHVRKSYQSESIAKGRAGAKEILRCLKNGQAVGMLLDQKMNDGIPIPFFGRDAMTAPAVATLAKKFECPVIPAQIIRTNGVGFRVIVHPPMYVNDTGDATADTVNFMTQINQMIEGWVREHPDQWFWVHNRWPK